MDGEKHDIALPWFAQAVNIPTLAVNVTPLDEEQMQRLAAAAKRDLDDFALRWMFKAAESPMKNVTRKPKALDAGNGEDEQRVNAGESALRLQAGDDPVHPS